MKQTSEPELELQIRKLALASQVCGLTQRSTIPAKVRAIIGLADAQKRGLSASELRKVCKICSTSENAVNKLINHSSDLVDEARRRLISEQGHLILPGGKLYPEDRAVACWRDCQQFLRVITYGVACNCPEITDSIGMESLLGLYKLVDVPVPALLFCLKQLRSLSALLLEGEGFDSEILCLNMATDDLIKALLPLGT